MSEFLESPAQLLAAYRLNGRTNYLSPEEITAAVQVVKQRRSASELKFVSVKHSEASKKEMLSAAAKGLPAPRSVRVLTFNAALNQTYVDFVLLSGKARGNSDTVTDLQALDGSRLSSSITMQDVQAALTPEDYAIIEKICQEYEPLLDALRRRGLDPKYLVADAWCVGYTGKECQSTERLAWPSLHYFDPSVDHTPYARPIEGINIRISLSKGKIIKFEDTGLGSVPVPGSFDTDSHYAPQDKMRTDLKPIVITQPFGPSFTIKKESNEILWLGWRMTIGFGGREGVTLHGIW